MAKKVPEKPERPKLRVLFPESGPKWLVLDPAKLAPVGGMFFTTLAMVYFMILQSMGWVVPPMDIVLGLLKTFVVSYAGTGLFVYFIMRVRDTEFPMADDPHKRLSLNDEDDSDEEDEQRKRRVVPGMNPDEPEEGEDIS